MPEAFDVAVVGAGPTGLTLAIQLAQQGHQILLVERHAEHYPLPRAVVFDSEAARGLAICGIANRFDEIREIGDDYVWLDADGDLLLRMPMREYGASGWPDGNLMTQPVLEEVLAARVAELPNIHFERGANAVGLVTGAESVRLMANTSESQVSWSTKYVVGADGASSFVRNHMDTKIENLGFFYDWLIVDLVLDDASPWVPMNRQICDPERPTTMVSGGPGRRRWEFMRMPGDAGEFNSNETAWRLLEKWGVTPSNANLERRAVYTFQASWADRWRDERLLIAGDAAHLMPPFAGMGMCSGIRDSLNLGWKLDLVLRGVSTPDLLDSYSTERSVHVRNAIHLSVELGKVICETDPSIVAGRNAHLKAAGGDPAKALPAIPPPSLGPGALQHGAAGALRAPAGQVAPQPRLRTVDGAEGRADEIVGPGLKVFVDVDGGEGYQPGPPSRRLLEKLGAEIVPLTSGTARPGVFAEAGTGMLATMRVASYGVCVVRPDFYIYGGTTIDGAEALIDELARDLHLASSTLRASPIGSPQ